MDRARALEVLARWQLPEGLPGWLLWARCAAASGAERAERGGGPHSLTLRFEGRPFTRAELEDPYAALFAPPGPRAERGRHFALGLLQALRSGASEVTVESGSGPERIRLRATGPGRETVEPAPGPETATVLGAGFGWAEERRARFLGWTGVAPPADAWLHPDRLVVAGADDGPPIPALRTFRLGAVRGRLCLPQYLSPPESRLSLYQNGVHVQEHREPLPAAKVAVWVDDDRLRLDASQAGVVRDRRFATLMRYLAREAALFAEETALAHPALMAHMADILRDDADAREVWRARLAWGPAGGGQGAPGFVGRVAALFSAVAARRLEGLSLVREAAEKTVWLRDVTSRLGPDSPEPLRAAVAAAPLLFAPDWRPLTAAAAGSLSEAELRLTARTGADAAFLRRFGRAP